MDKALVTAVTGYDEAVRWIYDRIDYERIRPVRTSDHFRLERVERLLSLIDSPQKRIPAIHIAGTKGKGSTAAMLHSILTESGICNGLFTSPHLHLFEERMRVNQVMPTPEELTLLVTELRQRLEAAGPDVVADGPTYFEVATLLGWMFFDRRGTELVVLETGLGGRLDCTNVCRPLVTIITTIGLDHTHILGNTLPQIAAEKAGIIKPGIPVLTWATQPGVIDVIRQRAVENGCAIVEGDVDLREEAVEPDERRGSDEQVPDGAAAADEFIVGSYRYSQTCQIRTPFRTHHDLKLALPGDHQRRNAALAVCAADFVAQSDSRITEATVARGLAATRWPLRFEIFRDVMTTVQPIVSPSSKEHSQSEPTVSAVDARSAENCRIRFPALILDAAHNPDSLAAFLRTLNQIFPRGGRRTLIFAASQDKDAQQMLTQVAPCFDRIILTRFQTNPRAYAPEILLEMLRGVLQRCAEVPEVVVAADPAEALVRAAGRTSAMDSSTPESGTEIVCGTGSVFLAAELRQLLCVDESGLGDTVSL